MNIFDDLSSKLQNTGLSENEIGVYLSLLKIGESTTGKILEDYKMSAGKIYIVLNKLIKKGLVTYIVKNNIKHFKAQDPGNIIDYLQREKKKIETKEAQIKSIIPELAKAIAIKSDDITVEIYEGVEGVKAASNRFISEHEDGATEYQFDNLSFENPGQIPGYLKSLMMLYSKKMIQKDIKLKMLLSIDNKYGLKEVKKVLKGTKYELRYLENQRFASILFSNGRTLIFDYVKPSVVYVRSKAIEESFRKMFESLWRQASKI